MLLRLFGPAFLGSGPEGDDDRYLGGSEGLTVAKRYMVSGSLCPLISFLDVSYLVSFVVRGQRPHRGR